MIETHRELRPRKRSKPVGTGGFAQFDGFAAPELCRRWMSHVHASRRRWRSYGGGLHCFGNSWYLDIERGDLHYYHAMSARSNRMIEELPGFVAAMRSAARHLVTRDGRRDLPVRARRENLGPYWIDCGIHLLGGMEGHCRGGVTHADYEGLAPYPAALFDPGTEAFSCILSLQTPDKGGGLEIWPEQRYLGNRLGVEKRLRPQDAVKLSYAPGTLTILDSFLYHRLRDCWFTPARPWRVSGVIHFLLRDDPYPHWEHWF